MKTQRLTSPKWLALGSFALILLFAFMVVALHVLRPQLNPVSQTISDYAIGPYGYLMTIAFIIRGLGELFLFAGLKQGSLPRSRSSTGLILLIVAAMSSFVVAIFPADPQNGGIFIIHSLGALLGFTSVAVAALVWSRTFRDNRSWGSSARTSLTLGLLMLLSLIAFLASPSGLQGLTERMLEVFMVVWLCFMSWRLSTN